MSSRTKEKSYFLKTLSFIINKVWLLFAFLIISIATLFLLLELLLPEVNRYKSDIVTWIENRYQIDIEVDEIAAKWSSTGPSLSLRNFSLLSDDKTFKLFDVGFLSIEFDLLASILNKEYSTRKILLDDASFRFYIDSQLGVSLNNLSHSISNNSEIIEKNFKPPADKLDQFGKVSNSDIETTSKRFFQLLVAQRKIEIVNSKLELKTLSESSFLYDVENLKVNKFDNHHQLIGQLRHTNNNSKQRHSLSLVAEVFHGLEDKDNYTNLYLDVNKIDLESIPYITDFFELDKNEKASKDSVSNALEMNENSTKFPSSVSLKMWAKWQDKHWSKMDAEFTLSGKSDLSAILSWRNDDYYHGYAELHDLSITNDEQSNDIEINDSIYIKYVHREREAMSWNISMDSLNIEPLSNYFSSLLSNQLEVVNFLRTTQPKMMLRHFNYGLTKNYQKVDLGWQASNLTFEFAALEMNAQSYLPTFSQLDGWLLYNFQQAALQVKLASHSSELIIKDLFRQNIPITNFEVDLMSELSNGFSELNISQLTIENEDLKLSANSKFYYDEGEPNLSLKAKVNRGDVSKTSRYLPTGIMSTSLVEYLDESIQVGNLIHANAVLRGPLKEFPYPNQSGVFSVLANVNDAKYRFLPDWPIVNNAAAKLLFDGPGMFIDVTSAESEGNRLNFGQVNIVDMVSDDSKLDLSLDLLSTNNLGRYYLNNTPLDFLSNGIKDLSLDGRLHAKIDLEMPLADNELMQSKMNIEPELKLQGSVQPIGSNLTLTMPFIKATSVTGKLDFNEKGIIKSHLTGLVDDNRVMASIESFENSNSQSIENEFMRIDLEGNFASKTIDQFLEGNWSDFLTGSSKFTGEVLFVDNVEDIAESKDSPDSKIKVNFRSELKGMTINVPDFMHKEKDASKFMNLGFNFFSVDNQDIHVGEVSWDKVNAKWQIITEFEKDERAVINKNKYSVLVDINSKSSVEELELSEVEISDSESKNNDESKELKLNNENWSSVDGITVNGHLDKIDVPAWSDFYNKVKENYSSILTLDEDTNTNQRNNFEWIINKVNLSANSLEIPGIDLIENARIRLDKYIDLPWHLSVNSEQGNLEAIFEEDKPWLINAKDIDLTLIDVSKVTETHDNLDSSSDLFIENEKIMEPEQIDKENLIAQKKRHYHVYTNLPEMDISCTSCMFNQKDLGNFRTSIRRDSLDNKAISIVSKVKKEKEYQLALNGTWSMQEKDENDQYSELTDVDFKLNTNNVGQLLKNWGFDPSIEDSKGTVVGSLNWDNSPWRLDYKKLNGDARLDFGKGYLSEISDEEGRIIALFNLKSILRKLTFDFKDVYKKGFFYDSMGGTIELNDGVISTYDTSIKGNVADVWLYGTTDLKNETVDQHAIVSPHITSSFPVLAAWALEPTTGIIVYLLNKIMEPAIDVATQIDYRVYGSFDEPKVEEIKKSSKRVKVNLDEVPIEDSPLNNNQQEPEINQKPTESSRLKPEEPDDDNASR